jgi:hypothetical protein
MRDADQRPMIFSTINTQCLPIADHQLHCSVFTFIVESNSNIYLSLLRIDMSPGKQKNPKRKEEDGTALKQAFMYSYFKRPKRQRGRPHKAGNLATDEITLEGFQANKKQRATPVPSTYSKKPPPKAPPVTESSKKVAKANRVNWSKGDAKQKLENAVSEWEDECGKALDSNGSPSNW